MPATTKRPADARERDRIAAANRSAAAKGREIGAVPDIADVRRRSLCRNNLRRFCEVYLPEVFYLPWSPDQLRSIARLEEAATLGALYAFAEPRGSGKTARVRATALWALAYGHVRYCFIIGANAGKAEEALSTVKTWVRFLPEFGADFPELSWPARCLGGIANRASGQTADGESTLIEWSADRVVLPTVRPPANWPKGWPLRADGMVPTAGGVLSASGLTGDGIRGSVLTLSTGELVRPDLVLLDDPQTRESASSPSQNQTRAALVGGDVLGMAAPGRTISAVMPCTVIEPGDFVDTILDRTKHPLWRGERSAMLRSLPDNLALWEGDYREVYETCAQTEPPDLGPANAFYLARRAELDAGAVAGWEARKLETEVSAVQHAMHLYLRDRRSFLSEYQNRPLGPDAEAGAKRLSVVAVAARTTGVPRGQVPAEASRLTAFVDVGGELLWWAAVAWDNGFGGVVADYGTWPEQRRAYFAGRSPSPGLSAVHPGLSEEQRVYAGLKALVPALVGRDWRRPDGTPVPVARLLVDSGDNTDAVRKALRAMPQLGGAVHPSKGKGRSATEVGVGRWKARPGERVGFHWRQAADRLVLFDPDAWKTFLFHRLTTPLGGAGAVGLFGPPADHALFADHLAAESAVPQTTKGDTYDHWSLPPARPDNHWLDCLVGAAVAAAVDGLEFHPGGRPDGKPRPVAKSHAEVVRRRLAARG